MPKRKEDGPPAWVLEMETYFASDDHASHMKKLARAVDAVDGALDGVPALARAADLMDLSEALCDALVDRARAYVAEARRDGATWEDVGASLGVTRQAAQQRFGVR
jgi:hypothetical protein